MSETKTVETIPGNGAVPAAVAPPAPKAVVEFDPDDAVALYMNTTVFAQLQRVGKMMAASSLVPDYLKQKEADCALVAAQAFRWRMDPFAVAAHSFAYKGKLGYEGKLIAALVNTSPKIDGNLDYIYTGEKGSPKRGVRVVGRLKGTHKDREVEGSLEEWKTDNDNWKKDPDQMLAYRGAREWARRHMPEVLLGVQADEEVAETITLNRTGTDTFGGVASVEKPASAGLDALTEQLKQKTAMTEATPPTVAPKDCKHPTVPPSRVAALAPGKSIACGDCGEEFTREREAGEDEASTPEPVTTKPAAEKKGAKGDLFREGR